LIDERSSLLNVFGGKITTYRKLAEHALRELQPWLKAEKGDWTSGSSLPGGDVDWADLSAYKQQLAKRYAFLGEDVCQRVFKCYGTRAEVWLADATSVSDLGQHFGAGLYQAEVDYLMQQEWAVVAADVIWRRTKLGLRLSEEQQAELQSYMSGAADAG